MLFPTSLPPFLFHAWSKKTFAGHFLKHYTGAGFVLEKKPYVLERFPPIYKEDDIYQRLLLHKPFVATSMTITWSPPRMENVFKCTSKTHELKEMQNGDGCYLLELKEHGVKHWFSWKNAPPDPESDPILQEFWTLIGTPQN